MGTVHLDAFTRRGPADASDSKALSSDSQHRCSSSDEIHPMAADSRCRSECWCLLSGFAALAGATTGSSLSEGSGTCCCQCLLGLFWGAFVDEERRYAVAPISSRTLFSQILAACLRVRTGSMRSPPVRTSYGTKPYVKGTAITRII
jgi:hypothetical protein